MARCSPLVAAFLSVWAVSFCLAQDSPVFLTHEHTRAPSFTLPDLDGKPVSSKGFSGRISVLSFGATWCASCVSELRSLEKLQARFPKDLVVYFIAMDGLGEKDVKPFMTKNSFRVPTLVDPHMEVAREYDIRW